ncbi:MAG: FAD-dependent oxidoreductase [Treponema sp.]|jgi:thioredoxin reductase (NADPH)|nr:FAD-dependent oxidoreductase [Treponema sp.]
MSEHEIYDILIIGGGPAGMTAALYAARAGKKPCIIDKTGFGGQITHSPKVENFPGTMEMSGNDFANRMAEQLLALDVSVEMGNAAGIQQEGSYHAVRTEEGGLYRGRSVIIASGAKHRTLGITGEEEWTGNGIYYCAVCDGPLFKDKSVILVGGGNSALQEGIHLSDICRDITMVQNLPDYTGEIKLRETVSTKPNVRAVFGTVVKDFIVNKGRLEGLRLLESGTGKETDLKCDGVFVAIGLVPENEAFAGAAELDQDGYITSGENCLTRTAGVFAAGDCRVKNVRQLTTAVSDGAIAALAACRYVDQL